MRSALVLVLVAFFVSAPAAAQSPYVAASAGVDVSRFDRVDGPGFSNNPGGEAVAFSVRVGAPLGTRWGVELAFTRPAEVTHDTTFGYAIPLPAAIQTFPGVAAGSAGSPVIFPPLDFGIHTKRRNSTLDTAARMTQRANSRIELAYLAGLSFSRVTETVSYGSFARPPGPLSVFSTRTTMYGVGPVVGFEARIGLTDHVMILPGLRLQTLGGDAGGWLLRAATGLGWQF
jgi:hypothetical protein